MRLARSAVVAGFLLVSILSLGPGCGNKAAQQQARPPTDPLVGKWREIDVKDGAGTLTFGADGSYRAVYDKPTGSMPRELAALAEAMEEAPARYNHRGDKEIMVSYDVKAIRKALAAAPNFSPDGFKDNNWDFIYTFAITGDLLELTIDRKTRRYMRVQ